MYRQGSSTFSSLFLLSEGQVEVCVEVYPKLSDETSNVTFGFRLLRHFLFSVLIFNFLPTCLFLKGLSSISQF